MEGIEMEVFFENSIIVLAILLTIVGAMLAATYIVKIGFLLEAQKAYISQIDACFIWSSILMFFGWLITTNGSDKVVCTGLLMAIILWLLIFIVAVIFMMLHFTKRFRNDNSSDYIFSLKDIGVRSIVFTFISIFLYWLVY
jgi:cbb3-type cytochrome oxidase subunit 3